MCSMLPGALLHHPHVHIKPCSCCQENIVYYWHVWVGIFVHKPPCSQPDNIKFLQITLRKHELWFTDMGTNVIIAHRTFCCNRISIAQSDRSGAQLVGLPSSSALAATPTNSDDQQLRALRSQIRLSESFSGVNFDNVSWEITQKGIQWILMYPNPSYPNALIIRNTCSYN